MNINEAIAANVRAHRARKQLTQKELAKKCGLSQSRISRIEEGNYLIYAYELFDLAEALELSINQLIGNLASKNPTTDNEEKPC